MLGGRCERRQIVHTANFLNYKNLFGYVRQEYCDGHCKSYKKQLGLHSSFLKDQ